MLLLVLTHERFGVERCSRSAALFRPQGQSASLHAWNFNDLAELVEQQKTMLLTCRVTQLSDPAFAYLVDAQTRGHSLVLQRQAAIGMIAMGQ